MTWLAAVVAPSMTALVKKATMASAAQPLSAWQRLWPAWLGAQIVLSLQFGRMVVSREIVAVTGVISQLSSLTEPACLAALYVLATLVSLAFGLAVAANRSLNHVSRIFAGATLPVTVVAISLGYSFAEA